MLTEIVGTLALTVLCTVHTQTNKKDERNEQRHQANVDVLTDAWRDRRPCRRGCYRRSCRRWWSKVRRWSRAFQSGCNFEPVLLDPSYRRRWWLQPVVDRPVPTTMFGWYRSRPSTKTAKAATNQYPSIQTNLSFLPLQNEYIKRNHISSHLTFIFFVLYSQRN